MEQETPPVEQGIGGSAGAQAKVNAPGIALMITAILGMVIQALGIVLNVVGMGATAMEGGGGDESVVIFAQGGVGIALGIVSLIVGVIVFLGASKMRKLESYGFAMTASIIAMVPCVSPCCILGLPFGIWALVVLMNEEVKAAFR